MRLDESGTSEAGDKDERGKSKTRRRKRKNQILHMISAVVGDNTPFWYSCRRGGGKSAGKAGGGDGGGGGGGGVRGTVASVRVGRLNLE